MHKATHHRMREWGHVLGLPHSVFMKETPYYNSRTTPGFLNKYEHQTIGKTRFGSDGNQETGATTAGIMSYAKLAKIQFYEVRMIIEAGAKAAIADGFSKSSYIFQLKSNTSSQNKKNH